MSESFVYFIADGHGRVKIGRSTHPAGRLAQLQTGTGLPLTLIGAIPGDRIVEAQMHERFAERRLQGEWFTQDDNLRAQIDSIIAEIGADLAGKPKRKGTAVAVFLRGLYPTKTAEHVAADIERETVGLPLRRVKIETIATMLDRNSNPSFEMTIALIGTYGPDFIAAVYPRSLGWLAPARLNEEIADLRRAQAAMKIRLDALV